MNESMSIAGAFEITVPQLFPPGNGIYAIFCEGCSQLGALKLAERLMGDSGKEWVLRRLHFNPYSPERLERDVEDIMLEDPFVNYALLVSPGFDSRFEPGKKIGESMLITHLDELRYRLRAAEFPVLIALPLEGTCLNQHTLSCACEEMDFIRVDVKPGKNAVTTAMTDRETEAAVALSGIDFTSLESLDAASGGCEDEGKQSDADLENGGEPDGRDFRE